MLGLLLSVLKIAVLVYLGLCLLVSCRQASFIYYPTSELRWDPVDVGLPYEDVFLSEGKGDTIHGWFVPVDGAEYTVLFFHGNAGNIGDRVESIKLFADMGLNVMIVDYPGYGRSTGKPTEDGTYEAARLAWMHLVQEHGLSPKSITVFGRSLGGAVAAWLAEQEAPRSLILESTFTSVPDMGKEIYPFLPVRLLARFKYDTGERIGRVDCPVLVIHSPQDDIVPYHHGRRIFDAAGEPKRFHDLSGGHNSAVFDGDYRDVIREFIEAEK